ncbi:MAG TPA: hypothetical protein VEV83_22600, partial [Parafilimonas sp.]|nr:hypothetical protein [Parafilimonas sp.]
MRRIAARKILLALISLFVYLHFTAAQSSGDYINAIMAGISNNGLSNDKEYLTAGDRTYIVGTQSGNFPDLGGHVKGEMGGLWMPPVKLLDGFWMKISDVDEKSDAWMKEAKQFINYPYGNKFIYAPVLNGIEVERFQFCPQARAGIVIEYELKNESHQQRNLQLEFVVKTDVSPVWFSTENNIIDAPDTVQWLRDKHLFAASDTKHAWFALWGSKLAASTHNTNAIAPVETIG